MTPTGKHYTAQRHQQIVLSLMKQYGVKRVIASPGTTNLSMVASMQADPWFEIYSSVDERSAAYMACGMAAESGQPVAITCTGATASRNYFPGLTEAYYRKLPVLALTATQNESKIGHLEAQVIDRSRQPADTVVASEHIGAIANADDEWAVTIKANRALTALTHNGGGPVHINLATTYSNDFSVEELPVARKITTHTLADDPASLPQIGANERVAVWIGNHAPFSAAQTEALNRFCETHGAVVFGDHTSNYHGPYFAFMGITATQKQYASPLFKCDVLVHIGEVSADYSLMAQMRSGAKRVWRVSPDGEIRDLFHKLSDVFAMPEENFFNLYGGKSERQAAADKYVEACRAEERKFRDEVGELPFSNPWISQHLAPELPKGAIVHYGILNSIRCWNFWPVDPSIEGFCNSGGFGIDGAMSTCMGGALARPDKLHFLMLGDLAFFYDLNSLGNRHFPANIRILLVNNGMGTEFRNYHHPGHAFGEAANDYIAAAGHFGNKSPELVKRFAEALGFDYITASGKEEFKARIPEFVSTENRARPMVFEVFTNHIDESNALHQIDFLAKTPTALGKQLARKVLPGSVIEAVKKIVR